MMNQIKRITFRLCTEKPKDKEIADYLSDTGRKKYHTVNSAIKALLYEQIKNPTSECFAGFDMKAVVSVIRETIESEISKLTSGVYIKNEPKAKSVTETATNSDEDIDMSFIGG